MGFFIGCGVILAQGDKYILVQETRYAKKDFYNLPAGTLELNEDILACVIRETREETGADVSLEHFVGLYQTVLANDSNILFFVFAGSVDASANFRSNEHSVIEALSYEEIVAHDKAGKLRSPIVLKCISDYRAGQKFPLSAVQALYADALDSITVGGDH